jgi:hypothetical protein
VDDIWEKQRSDEGCLLKKTAKCGGGGIFMNNSDVFTNMVTAVLRIKIVQFLARIFWDPKVHRYVHKSPPLAPILEQTTPVQAFRHYSFNIIRSVV